MTKKRVDLKPDKEAELRRKIVVKLSLTARKLMAEYNVSREVIDRITREVKRGAQIERTAG